MRGFVNIGFGPDASETAEAFVHKLVGFTVDVETPGGTATIPCTLLRVPEWDGEDGLPVIVRLVDEDGTPYGEEQRLDAVHIYVW